MRIIDVRHKMPVKGSNGTMDKKKMDLCIIHHDGVNRPLIYDSLKRYISEANYHISKGWKRISYHYSIDNIGDVYWLNDLTEVLYHAGNLDVNKRSIAIKFDGNMENQQLTSKQKTAYKELIEYLCTQRPDLPKILKPGIKMHKEIKSTACPGKNSVPTVIANR